AHDPMPFAIEQAADSRYILAVENKIVWFGPNHRLGRLDTHERVARAIRNRAKRVLVSLYQAMCPHESLVEGHSRLSLHPNRRIDCRHLVDQLLVVRAIPRLIELELLVKSVFLDVRQDLHPPAQERFTVLTLLVAGQAAIRVVIIMPGQSDLL